MKKIHLLALLALILSFISGAAVSVYWPQTAATNSKASTTSTTTKKAKTPKTEQVLPKFYCSLDGAGTTEEKSLRRPIAVMVENFTKSRPQSGLIDACIIYETVAEGGITRFMAVYQHSNSATIGPVRSAREYFANLARQLDAFYAHCGGPATIYGVFKNLGLISLDEFANSSAYWRLRSRYAPHNLYTSTEKLDQRIAARGYETTTSSQGYFFKDDIPPSKRPASTAIEINFSKPAYLVRYEYEPKTNSYKRFMGVVPHNDAENGRQISPKNVIVQYVSISNIANDPKGRLKVRLIGSGEAVVFRDGEALQATWRRDSVSDLTRFYDSSGAEIKLNRGQTWIELIDPTKMWMSIEDK